MAEERPASHISAFQKKKFKTMKVRRNALIFSPVFAILKSTGHKTLDLKAHDIQVAGCCYKISLYKTTETIAYKFHFFTETEHRNKNTQCKRFTFLSVFKLLRPYLENRGFQIKQTVDQWRGFLISSILTAASHAGGCPFFNFYSTLYIAQTFNIKPLMRYSLYQL